MLSELRAGAGVSVQAGGARVCRLRWNDGLGDGERGGSKSGASGVGRWVHEYLKRRVISEEAQSSQSFSAQCLQLMMFPQPDVPLLVGYIRACCHNSRCVQQLWLEFPSKNTAEFGGSVDGSTRNASAASCQRASKAHLGKVPCKQSKSILI